MYTNFFYLFFCVITPTYAQCIFVYFLKFWKTGATAADARLRAHFETVLEHAHEQLTMALALNDSVDKRWMEDVQRRNKQTLEGMKSFQSKCQRLYEERLKDYVASTEEQL